MKKLQWFALFTVLLLLVALPAMAAGGRHATVSPTPVPMGTIEGVVTDANSAAALSGVTVKAGGYTATTGRDGRYSITIVPGSFTVSFEKQGFTTATVEVDVPPAQASRADMALSLAMGTVSGVVSDSTNGSAPLAMVEVSVVGGTERTTTDAQGRYTFTLRPGSYTLTFKKDGYVDVDGSINIGAGQDKTLNRSMMRNIATIQGVVSDAIDPTTKISGVTVKLGTQTAHTDAAGRYSFTAAPGTHTITFEKDGFISTNVTATATAGNTTQADCSMSRELASNQYRVVLRWGDKPFDLDSHLLGRTSRGAFHVVYNDKIPTGNSAEAKLDVDDTNSYGPETTTFVADSRYDYTFYVHDFSAGNNTSRSQMNVSGATVTVYTGDQLLYTFNVPTGQKAIYWVVFKIDNGQFIPIDRMQSSPPTN